LATIPTSFPSPEKKIKAGKRREEEMVCPARMPSPARLCDYSLFLEEKKKREKEGMKKWRLASVSRVSVISG